METDKKINDVAKFAMSNQEYIRGINDGCKMLTEKLQQVSIRCEMWEEKALRQVAEDIEYELKVDLLGEAPIRLNAPGKMLTRIPAVAEELSPIPVSGYRFKWGPEKGTWDAQAVRKLKIHEVEKLVEKFGRFTGRHWSVLRIWFGEDVEVGRQKFTQAMMGMKQGPKPVQRESITIKMAKDLVNRKAVYPYSKVVDAELRATAIRYVELLGKIRTEGAVGVNS